MNYNKIVSELLGQLKERIDSAKNKKKEAFSLLENLLKDDEEEEDDTTFKDLKTSKWNEDDN